MKLSFKNKGVLIYVPFILVIVLIPLFVIGKEYYTDLSDKSWYSINSNSFDYFLYWKSRAIMLLGYVLFLVALCRLQEKRSRMMMVSPIKNHLGIGICLGIYLTAIVISTIFSENKRMALFGGFEQFEGAFVLCAYLILFCYAFCIFYRHFFVKLFYAVVLTATGLMTMIGLLQFFHIDFFRSGFGSFLIKIAEPSLWGVNLIFNFEPGRVYMTLYNPNYVGSYVALMLPVIVSGIFALKHRWAKLAASFISIGMILSLIGSESVTGYIALLCLLMLFIALMIANIKRIKKVVFILLGSSILLGIVFIICKPDTVQYMYRKIFETPESRYAVQRFEAVGDKLFVYSNSKRMEVKENAVAIEPEFEGFVFTPHTYTDVTKTVYEGIQVTVDGHSWDFVREDGKYKFFTPYNRVDEIKEIPTFGFENHQRLGSRRGYIWSRTIPLIPKHLLIGAGPDHFVLTFPNNDYVGLENNDYRGRILTKPHNMYMQMIIQTGLVSLIAFLSMYFLYFIRSIRLFFKVKHFGVYEIIGIGIFLGTFGFMAAGLANDSSVTVSPLFWVLFGTGTAINYQIANKTSHFT
ncbi:MAG: O-antigen ligase family protein [Lachnoclostridium sp.]|nr:O-antigen ligase family protein [Lachnoclostridium sp.]